MSVLVYVSMIEPNSRPRLLTSVVALLVQSWVLMSVGVSGNKGSF